jgi:hypothetical protein
MNPRVSNFLADDWQLFFDLPQLSGKLQLSHQLGVRIATAGVIPALSLHPLTLFVAPMLLDLVFAVLAFAGESLVLDRAAEV